MNDVSVPSVQVESTALPPPRAFGDTNTLTLARSGRRGSAQELAARLADASRMADAAGHVHLAVVPADGRPITLTF